MEKSKINVGIIIIVALGLLIMGLTYVFLSSTKTTIYVFKDSYKAGTKISADMLVPQQIDNSIVQQVADANDGNGYVTDNNASKIAGDYLREDVLAGQPLMLKDGSKFGGTAVEAKLSPNMVAVTVPADNITGASPFIQSGARVDVFAGFQYQNNSNTTYMILQNIKVLDVVYSEAKNDSSKSPTLQGVTVEVSPQDAVELQFACEYGKVRLGLVKAGQYKDSATQPYSQDQIKSAGSAQPTGSTDNTAK